MIRFIVQLLIVSLLTMNIAWAADACAFTETSETNGIYFQASDQPPADPINTAINCDDWCYTWVHPLALTSAIVPVVYIPATIDGGNDTLSYSSLPIPPPFHPPII